MTRRLLRAPMLAAALVAALPAAVPRAVPAPPLVLDGMQLLDGTGRPPIPNARLVIEGDRIRQAGPAASVAMPGGAEVVHLRGRTVIPGLIDSHFHIERDPDLALRQLANGVTTFRDPGQWEEAFEGLRRTMAEQGLRAPRIFTAGPHIDGEGPAYPADAVVARDAEEARRFAERAVDDGATALKIYFRLPLAGARAVIDVCRARGVPCTAHLEILDAREALRAGLHGIEHITSLGPSLLPRREREAYRQAVLADNDARRLGRYEMFARLDLDGPQAQALYEVLRVRRPWLDATLAVFERRAAEPPEGVAPDQAALLARGFGAMKRLTCRAAREGARVVVGGHTQVPFAGRGEAPWRELELLVESGFTPLEAIQAATGTAAGFLYREADLGTLAPGRLADLVVLEADPLADIANLRSVSRVMAGGAWVDVERYREY